MHAWSKKHFHCLYNMHLFLPYLLIDSQTILSTIHFLKNLLCLTLIYSDWSDNPVCCDWSTACSACRKGNAHQQYWIMAYQVYAVSEQTTWFQFCLINSSTSPTRKRPELLMNPALYAFKSFYRNVHFWHGNMS